LFDSVNVMVLSERIYRGFVLKVNEVFPVEVCAVLFGDVNGDIIVVRRVSFLSNLAKSSTRFVIDPIELYHVYVEAEREGLDLVGIFHSHRSKPFPSAIDCYYMELNPVPWLIFGLVDGEWVLKCFKLSGGRIVPVAVEVKE